MFSINYLGRLSIILVYSFTCAVPVIPKGYVLIPTGYELNKIYCILIHESCLRIFDLFHILLNDVQINSK